MQMSPGLLRVLGPYGRYRSDESFRLRVTQLALPPRQMRYLIFEMNWQNFILDTMALLEHRGDDYFNCMPIFFKVAFLNFGLNSHISRLRNIQLRLDRYPSVSEGVALRDELSRFHIAFRENFEGWCTPLNMAHICLASSWEFPLNADHLAFAQARIFSYNE